MSLFGGGEFSKGLFTNYWTGGGNLQLSGPRFADILKNAQMKDNQLHAVTFSNGEQGYMKYAIIGGEYKASINEANIYYNQAGIAVGFSDNFNFNPKGYVIFDSSRKWYAEIATRGVLDASLFHLGEAAFEIRYGLTPTNIPNDE